MDSESIAEATPVHPTTAADHAGLEELLEMILTALESGDREKLRRSFPDFEFFVSGHFHAQEALLIPALFRVARTRDATAIFAEHRHLRTRLDELKRAMDLEIATAEAVRDLLDEVRAHGRSEERILNKETG